MTKAWLEAGFQSEQVDLEGRKLVFKRVTAAPTSAAFAESSKSDFGASPKLSLFGWLRGTVVSTGDLTEPADPDWARRIADELIRCCSTLAPSSGSPTTNRSARRRETRSPPRSLADEPVYVSPITAWEVGLLAARGRISLRMSPEKWFDRLLDAPEFASRRCRRAS